MKSRTSNLRPATALPSLIVALVVGVCCVLPLGWMAWQLAANPDTLRALRPDSFQWQLLGRTLGYNGACAFLATAMALPAAVVLGRGPGKLAAALWFVLPIALLMPSLAYAYGWSQFLRLLGVTLTPAGVGDVSRCVFTLAAWLWPLPAGIIGLSLRRIDANLQQQALLDGVLWRVTARQLAGPIAASLACVTVLASQEFAVYEPTGISVVATETRMVYETGLYSSRDNPITAPMAGRGAAAELADAPRELTQRSAAALATSLPLLAVVAVFGLLTARGARWISAAEELDAGPWPRALDAGTGALVMAWAIVSVTLLVPTTSLILARMESKDRPMAPLETLVKFRPQLFGSLLLAAMAGATAAVVAASATLRRRVRWPMVASLVTFLAGGQLLAIALIRLYNRPGLGWAYDGPPIVVMAYFARFGWLALLAAAVTRSRPWRPLREVAAVDGAGEAQTALHVVWPLAWPLLAASAVLVAVLSLTEVPATVLISPLRPQPLVPMLMTWVHMQRYDDMLEASLLLMSLVLVLGIVVAALVGLFVRLSKRGWRMGDREWNRTAAARAILYPLFSILVFSTLSGCGDGTQPEEIWLRTGAGPGQVVYPRCIDYDAKDDTFFVVDRLARVQHIDHNGNFLNAWQMPDWKIGKPTGVTVGPDGNVYLADTHYQRVMVYAPDGTFLRKWGEMGKGPGQFIYPTDIAFDKNGNVFVSEYGDNDRIQVFSPKGEFLYTFGRPGRGDGELARPQSMVIDDGLVYVTDASNHRISVFKTDGSFVRTMGSLGAGLGQFRWPYGLTEDRDGNLVVCEFGNNRVQLVDKKTGRGLKVWGVAGRGPGELAYPWAVAVDKRGRIVTVDAGNNRLQVFEF